MREAEQREIRFTSSRTAKRRQPTDTLRHQNQWANTASGLMLVFFERSHDRCTNHVNDEAMTARIAWILGLAVVVQLMLACESKSQRAPVAVPAESATKPAAGVEPALAIACSVDSDCPDAAPRCLGFGEDAYVARAGEAAVMHCSRPCESVSCPTGYACRRQVVTDGSFDPGLKGASVHQWCGSLELPAAVPIDDIPRHVVASYFAPNTHALPVVTMFNDKGEFVVIAPGSTARYADRKQATDAFLLAVADVASWTVIWPTNIPRNPTLPWVIPYGAAKTLRQMSRNEAFAKVSARVKQEGNVITWSRGAGFRVLRTEAFETGNTDDALALFFKKPAT